MMVAQTKQTQKNTKDNPPVKKVKQEKSTQFDGRIALFGCRAAGKTVYISSLYHEHHGSAKGLDVRFLGDQSAGYVNKLNQSILQYPRSWPKANETENELCLELKLDSALVDSSPKVTIQLFDPPGEWLELDGGNQADAQAMRDFVAGADGILFFFEPDNFAFQVLRDKIKRALPELQKWAQTVERRLDDLITALIEENADILALLKAKNLDNQLHEVQQILANAPDNTHQPLLKGLFRDAELSNLLRKYELNVELIFANTQVVNNIRTPTGKPVDVLYPILQYIQETAANQDNNSESELLRKIESYFNRESNTRLLAAVTRLKEIYQRAEKETTAENRSIAVIITKADELAVFRQAQKKPYVLIPPHLEHLKFKTGEDRFEKLREALKQHWEKQDAAGWGSIIDQLFSGRFKAFFFDLMSFPGDFQIFFVSSVGEVKRDENGFVQPPQGDNFQPQGVDQPILWIAQQIYPHAMVHRAMRRTLRWAIFPLLLLLIPATLFTYNVFLQSALERENNSVPLQVIQSYERLESWPMPPKHAITISIALLSFQHHWVAYQQNYDLFSTSYRRSDEKFDEVEEQLETLTQITTDLINTVAQHQPEILMQVKQLATIVEIEHHHLSAWKNYQQLFYRLTEINLTGRKNEIASLLTKTKEVETLTKTNKKMEKFANTCQKTEKPVNSFIDSASKKMCVLQQMQQAIASAIKTLEGYQTTGVPMIFNYDSRLNVKLSVPNNKKKVEIGGHFHWLPEQGSPMVLHKNTKLYEPSDFNKKIAIKVDDKMVSVNLKLTWQSYVETLGSVLDSYESILSKVSTKN